MVDKHLKKYSTPVIIREMQTKTTLRFHLTQSECLRSKTQSTVHIREGVEQGEHSFVAGGIANLYNHSGNQCSGL